MSQNDLSLIELLKKFPDDTTAEQWFVETRWPDGIECPHCEYDDIQLNSSHKTQPYRCRACKRHFSVRVGTVLQGSRIGYQKWAIAIYLLTSSPKGISSIQLGKALGIPQKTAWYLAHRIREGWREHQDLYDGPVEVDETYIGGRERNKHADKKLRTGDGFDGKIPVVGARDRNTGKVSMRVVEEADKTTLHNFIRLRVRNGSKVYTDGSYVYDDLNFVEHGKVIHSHGQYVDGDITTNSIESVWAIVKRSYKGVYHYFSKKHLRRYVTEFQGRHNNKQAGTVERMTSLFRGMIDRRLKFDELIKGG
ncbi:MAG: IS1595 family transposase [Gemmatimonadota bacterium]|nr:IS1595 family transposase [Gemmatimonadota bacterium]